MKKVLATMLFVACFNIVHAQTKEELQKKEADIRKELAELSNTLSQIQKNKKTSVAQVAAVQRKIAAREELISTINKQVRAMDETIYQNEVEIYRLRKELDTLKQKYAQSIVFAYKNRSSYQYLNFLFSSTSFNDAIKRATYLKSYRQLRETQVNTILKTQEVLQNKIGVLNNSKKEQSMVLQTQQSALQDLEQDKKEKDLAVKELKGKEKEVAKQINQKEKQRQDMRNAITAIIRREQAEADRLAKIAKKKEIDDKNKNKKIIEDKNSPKTNPSTTASSKGTVTPDIPKVNPQRTYSVLESTEELKSVSIKFEQNKGKLPWPVSVGSVLIPFGRYTVEHTKIVAECDGIEIAVPEGTPVKCVADGKVSYVGDIGGEQVVIVKHGKYFTTYSHLSSANVSKDQELHAGTVVGKSGTDLDGQGVLLFIVTNEKGNNYNPQLWLKGR